MQDQSYKICETSLFEIYISVCQDRCTTEIRRKSDGKVFVEKDDFQIDNDGLPEDINADIENDLECGMIDRREKSDLLSKIAEQELSIINLKNLVANLAGDISDSMKNEMKKLEKIKERYMNEALK